MKRPAALRRPAAKSVNRPASKRIRKRRDPFEAQAEADLEDERLQEAAADGVMHASDSDGDKPEEKKLDFIQCKVL